MRIRSNARPLLGAIIAVAALCGCSGTGSSVSPATSALPAQSTAVHGFVQRPVPSVMAPGLARGLTAFHQPADGSRPAAGSAFVYSCEFNGSDCRVFNPKSHKQLTMLTSTNGLNNPQGNGTDAAGDWYVANTGAGNVLEFGAGGGALKATLDDTGWFPVDVAVHSSLVAVSNLNAVSFTPGTLDIYSGGATEPSYVLSDPLAMSGIGVAFDSHGNCFWSFNNESGEGQVDEFPACAPSATPTNLNIVMGFAGGVAFDGHDNLWYVDQYHGVYACSGVTNCQLVSMLDVRKQHDALFINFNATDKTLYVGDAVAGAIYRINAASHKRTVFKAIGKKDPPFGVATSP